MSKGFKIVIALFVGGAIVYSAVTLRTTLRASNKEILHQIQSVDIHETSGASASPWTIQPLPRTCQLLPFHLQHASALAIWNEHIQKIHSASQLPKDPDYEFHDLTAQLLHLISPRLPNSIKAVPRDWSSVHYVLEEVLLPRWNYLTQNTSDATLNLRSQNNQQDDPPRPVKIVVMGGSVVSGVNCLQLFSKKVGHTMTRQQCAWPFRLQNFLDRVTGIERLFEVHAVVMGGSNTVTGNAILEFDLLPIEAKHPDIIIHAYATNDMHLQSFNQGENTLSWREKIMTTLQDFIRLAYNSTVGSCLPTRTSNTVSKLLPQRFPPVVMHLDDYLGNEQRQILATTELSQAVAVLANYYGTLTAMSYPDVVRDWVYGDTHEFWFSPFGWYPPYKQNKQQMAREIHPGMPAHMTVPWIISYNMLNLLTTYCDSHSYAHDDSQTDFDGNYITAREQRGMPLPVLKGNIRFPGRPKRPPGGLPPPLHAALSLQHVSDLWRNQSLLSSSHGKTEDTNRCIDAADGQSAKCPFAWVSGLLQEHNALDEADIEEYFKNHSVSYQNSGWEVKRHVDGRKIGFVPRMEQPGAKITMEVEFPFLPVRHIVIFYLRSYGDRWDNSELQVSVEIQNPTTGSSSWDVAVSRKLLGFHGKNTSEVYTERLVLSHLAHKVRLRTIFVRGKVFKIMGLLACH